MAYDIIGVIHFIGQPVNIQTKTGGALVKRTLVIMQRRFNRTTGEEYSPNYVSFDFSQQQSALLDSFAVGQLVKVSFDITGTKYNDKNTGQERYFTGLRGFKIELYVPQQQQSQQQYQQPQQQYQPQQQPQYQQPMQYQQPQYQQPMPPAPQNPDPPF